MRGARWRTSHMRSTRGRGPQPTAEPQRRWLHSATMDLHVIGPLASPAERAAVDAVLGPADIALGRRRTRRRARRPRLAGRTRRPRPARPAAARPPRRAGADRLDQPAGPQLRRETARRAARRGVRRGDVLRAVRDQAAAAGRRPCLRRHRLPAGRRRGRSAPTSTRALGEAGAAARRWPVHLAPVALPGPVRPRAGGAVHHGRGTGAQRRRPRRSTRPGSPRGCARARMRRAAVARAAPAGRRSGLASCGASASSIRPRSATTAEHGGFRGLHRALRDRAGSRSSRRSRRRAWSGAAAPPSRPGGSGPRSRPSRRSPHYVVCNADESEPGTFKDRVLLEGDPYAIVEAMTIAASRSGPTKGYIYLRGEYPEAEARVTATRSPSARSAASSARRPRVGLRLRHRAPARRRRLHLRRGDGALRVDRGQARRAAEQAAVPGRGRAVRQADRGQQRRDAGQRPADPRDGRRGLRRDRCRRHLDRAEALLPVRARGATRAPTRSSSGRRCAT